MAPRTAKTKKAADDKVISEVEAPKKGRSKAKAEPIEDLPEAVLDGKSVTDKKPKRGKKAPETNGQHETNGINEELVPPTKKGKKKNVAENGDNTSEKDDSSATKETENGHEAAANVIAEEAPTKGRKKPTKKEAPEKTTESKTGKGRNNAETEKLVQKLEDAEEKPKSAGKGRGRKTQPKETEQKTDSGDEEKVELATTKGKKKALVKVQEQAMEQAENSDDNEEPTEEVKPQKKEMKPRKNQGKKAQTKADSEEEETAVNGASLSKKAPKKAEKGKDDGKDAEDAVMADAKPAKGKRGQKKVAEVPTEIEEEAPDAGGETNSKRKRKAPEEKAPVDPKKKAPLKNKSATDYESIDFSNSSKTTQDKDWNFKIACWNVDGIRAWMSKGGLDYIKYEKPDILCLQEVKCSQDAMPEDLANIPGYHAYWLCSDQDGYAGVGVYTTKLAMNVQYGLQNKELDSEGRIITAEYEQFYLICTYVPNASRKLVNLPKRLQWNEEFRRHVKELDKKKPVIVCGDMNVAHNEIDLSNPKTNRKNAGFTDEERAGMTDLLRDGFVDTYRHLNPNKTGAYTFWTYMMNCRAKNVGWRLDYFLVSTRLMTSVCDSVIRDQVYGSDHCPISLFLHLTTADKPKE